MKPETPMLDVVDRSLEFLIDADLNNLPSPVHPLMADTKPSIYAAEGYENWLPIASTVTDAQLACLEVAIGHKLPPDYKAFLQYKHFYTLFIGQADFIPHPVDSWINSFLSTIDNFPKEYVAKGIIPFAMWGGAGDVLCFDSTSNQATADYPVVLWDHENVDSFENFSPNFAELLPQLEKETQ